MSETIVNFKNYLRTMFRKEDSSFNWGVYRIINQCNKEVDEFIDNQIPQIIASQIKEKGIILQIEIDKKIEELKIKCSEIGTDYRTTEQYKTLISQKEKIGLKDLDVNIYDNLLNFFSRYYQDGDFISKHYYSDGLKQEYMIPYDGSETYLYWPTKDQYYIKSGDEYKRFSFELGKITVAFMVIHADQEKNNVKEKGKKFFSISAENPFEWTENKTELKVRFIHQVEENPEKDLQDKYNLDAILKINKFLELEKMKERIRELDETTGKSHEIIKFQKRYTEDFFIHKNLKLFLDFELENYIMSEILNTRNLFIDSDLELNKNKILESKITKKIAEKIIDQLATIENLKKKVWEKKKFVLNTDYCITLDYIDEKYYLEILSNKKQLEDWKKLYSFDLQEKTNELKGKIISRNVTNPQIEILKQNPTMVIDTKFFDSEFKLKILTEIKDIDENITGLLINSDNYQALNLLLEKYKEKLKCCYIDPPYNAKTSEIIYKNSYRDASWISLMENRLELSKTLLDPKIGIQIIAIDEHEQENLGKLLSQVFGEINKTMIAVRHNSSGRQGDFLSYNHEYVYFISPIGIAANRDIRCSEEEYTTVSFRKTGSEDVTRESGKNCFYPIIIKNDKIIGFGDVCIDSFHPKSSNIIEGNIIKVYPIDEYGLERKWRYNRQNVESIKDLLIVKLNKNGNLTIDKLIKEVPFKSFWGDSKYLARDYGTFLLKDIMGEKEFDFPKSIYLVKDNLYMCSEKDSIILDYFAGSGTTGHAVLKLNKEDGGNRKFVLVEMGQYFDTVTKPRVLKVIYSDNWKDGKPLDNNGFGKQIIKYHTLEQYEDALENVEFRQTLLQISNDILLKYKILVSTKDSKTFFGADVGEDFEKFKIYTLNEKLEKISTTVDLIETFNYLIGLWVDKYIVKENLKDNNRKYICIKGKVNNEPVFIVWRNSKNLDLKKDKEFIEEELIVGQKYSQLFVNSDCAISGFKETYTEFRDKLW